MSKNSPQTPLRPKLTAQDKAEAILAWLDCQHGKAVPLHAADLAALEKQEWWQQFKQGERSATKAVFDKLAAQGISIHKQTKSPCHLLEGDETPTGFIVRNSHMMPPQLVGSPLNLKKWRQDHRMIRQLFKLYLKKTAHVRFFTVAMEPVKLSGLGAAITALHDRIGWLAHREWVGEAGLEFVLRKTELPIQNAGQSGAEQVFLHAHIAVRSNRRLGKEKWKALLEKLKQQSRSQFPPHDAGEIEDEDRQPNYLFKNPVASHVEDAKAPNGKRLDYEPLEKLTPLGTKQLYEALRKKRLVYPLGDFAEFISKLEERAEKAGKELKLQARMVGNQIQVKLVRVEKAEPRQKSRGPVKDLVIAKLPGGKRIVRGYSGANHLPEAPTK